MEVITSITAKDVLLLVMGALIALPITAGWGGIKGWFKKRADASSTFKDEWKGQLTSDDQQQKDLAFREMTIRAAYHFILGNMMFAVSGLAWIGDFLGLYPIQSLIAVLASVMATVYFLLCAKWINLYRTAYNFK